jgi:hypothetical protein
MSEHQWIVYDENHRGCPRCGLRLSFHRERWTLINYFGQPTSHLLGDGRGAFGSCTPPRQTSDLLVLIDYTGDPDVHPGCERFMHRIKEETLPADPRAAGGAALVQLGAVVPACSFRPTWWELGPPRKHQGWTWCADCFPLESIKGHRSDRAHSGPRLESAQRPALPPPAKLLPAAPAEPGRSRRRRVEP